MTLGDLTAVGEALTTLHAAACRTGETILAAYHGCDCPALALSPLTTVAEIAAWADRVRPYAALLPDDAADPIAASWWLEEALTLAGYRPGHGNFPARHSHTVLPRSAVEALRTAPDDTALLRDIARTFDVTPADCLAAALPDAPGWSPADADTGD